ncbi:MAG: NADH-quinone oxidoreductase subunit C [Acidobacteriaceae bacterium]|nr:NADH-quinone oxidoreductase subunit C [Acidobacteriaceae bacterium]
MNAETIKAEIEANVPGCRLQLVTNASPCAQHSLLLDAEHAVSVATYLREAAGLRFDFCSNVTGIDWPQREVSEKVKVKKTVDGVETEVDEVKKTIVPGYLEAVYHLYSMELKQGPVTLRMRTQDRETQVHLPSLMHVWRSADLQEREIFDLYGIIFDGHHDLRRLLMWEGFVDHPMRRDYVDPDDFEYEPTAHDEVLRRAQQHAAEAGGQ